MKTIRKLRQENQGLLQKISIQIRRRGGASVILGRYGWVKGLLILADWGAQFLHLAITNNLYKHVFTHRYGFCEAFFFPRTIDLWTRYSDVLEELYFSKNCSILEVGAGAIGLQTFLHNFHGIIISSDVSRDALRVGRVKEAVVCDACYLPFRRASFDVIVSVDVLEHIPKPKRSKCFDEFARVCLKRLIIHFPAVSTDRNFDAKKYDQMFQSFYLRLFSTEDSATMEHIKNEHPLVEEITARFPESRVVGRVNCKVWLRYMTLSCTPFLGFLAGIAYILFWKKEDHKPPFYKCKIVTDITLKY